MTILDFLKLTPKDKKEYCTKHGVKTRYDIEFQNVYGDALKYFCNKLKLSQGSCRTLSAYWHSGQYELIFYFYPEFNLVQSTTLHISDACIPITCIVGGTNEKSFRFSNAAIHTRGSERQINLFSAANKNNRYDSVYCECKLPIDVDFITEYNFIYNKFVEYLPLFNDYVKAIDDGSYFEYNKKINNHNGVGYTSLELETRLFIKNKYDILLTIEETLLMFKYVLHETDYTNLDFSLAKTFEYVTKDDVYSMLYKAREKYITNNNSKQNIKIYNDCSEELAIEVDNLVDKLSQKYNIHQSRFMKTIYLIKPIDWNCDLSKA